MKFEKNSLGSEASSYSSRKVSSSSYADAKPRRRRERTKEEENMVVGWESLASFSGPLGQDLVWPRTIALVREFSETVRLEPMLSPKPPHHPTYPSPTLRSANVPDTAKKYETRKSEGKVE